MQSRNMFTTALMVTINLMGVCQWANGQAHTDSMKDQDGNTYTLKIMLDHNQWMTQNLNIKVDESYCFADNPIHCNQYGRLYTFQSAMKTCKLLGESWRLPTNDEWASMASYYGGVRDQSIDGGKAAYKALRTGGDSDFNAQLGGNREAEGKKYARLQAHGFYWTSTETGNSTAWIYNFGTGAKILNRHEDNHKLEALSVRCIRSIER